jgi:hypothetical protein
MKDEFPQGARHSCSFIVFHSSFIIPLSKERHAMSQQNDTFNPFDPTGMFMSMRDANMDAWSKMMIQLVNTDAYAKATGTMLDSWLSTSTPFYKAMEAALTQIVTNLQLPSRADYIRLAERLTNIEMKLDDLDAKLDVRQRAAGKAACPET